MSSQEFSEWQVYEKMFGPLTIHERLDLLISRSDWLFANANRNPKKQKRPFKMDNFMPQWDKPPKKAADWKDLHQKMMMATNAIDNNKETRH